MHFQVNGIGAKSHLPEKMNERMMYSIPVGYFQR